MTVGLGGLARHQSAAYSCCATPGVQDKTAPWDAFRDQTCPGALLQLCLCCLLGLTAVHQWDRAALQAVKQL